MTASLTLTYGALNLTAYPYGVVWGTDTGAPENEATPLASFIQDGDVELSSRAGNRTIQFDLTIEGVNLTAMATAEAALIAETERLLNTLTLDPGDSAPAAVYEVFRGQVRLARDDDGEIARLRRYAVTVRALPFPRSATETVTAALPATGTTTTLVNDGSATTNWTGAVNGVVTAPSVVSGAVGITTAALSGAVTIALTYTASITTSATKILVHDWSGATAADTLRAYGDGTELTKIAEGASPTAGFTRTYFLVGAAASIAVLRLDMLSPDLSTIVNGPTVAAPRSFYVDNINRTDVNPGVGSARQTLRTIPVGGSARSPSAIAIEHGTSSLGDVLAYFWPATNTGYSPPLRQYRVSGGTVTTDATMVSGARETLTGSPVTFDIPARTLASGRYLLVARLNTGVFPTLTYTVSTRVNSTTVGAVQTYSKTWAGVTSYEIVTIGRVSLPTVDLPATTSGVVRITLASTVGSYDEVWLLNTDIGQLIQVACGTAAAASGGPAKRVFIEPATPAVPRPTIRIGHASDRSDSYYPSALTGVGTLTALEYPQLTPPFVNALLVTTNALDASLTQRGYRRWHTNPAS